MSRVCLKSLGLAIFLGSFAIAVRAAPPSAGVSKPAAPVNVDQLVYVYSPEADWNGAFSNDNNAALLAKFASDRGMRVVLLNADDMYREASGAEAEARLVKRIADVSRDHNSVLIISTHGGQRVGRNKQTDTALSMSFDSTTYSKIAEAIDRGPDVRAVILDSCHGFCSALQRSATKGGGKLVAAISASSKPGESDNTRVLFEALARMIDSKKPIALGPAYEAEVKRYLSACERRTKVETAEYGSVYRDESQEREDLLRTLPADETLRKGLTNVDACTPVKPLTIAHQTGQRLYTFGRAAPAVVDSAGRATQLCKSLQPKSNAVFLPGMRYDSDMVIGDFLFIDSPGFKSKIEVGSTLIVDEFTPPKNGKPFSQRTIPQLDFTCGANGRWTATIHRDRESDDEKRVSTENPDPDCTQPGHKYVKLDACKQPTRFREQVLPVFADIKKIYLQMVSPDELYYPKERQCLTISQVFEFFAKQNVAMPAVDTTGVCEQGSKYYFVQAGRRAPSPSGSSH